MKVVFAGPSLPDARNFAGAIDVRGPAMLGDVAKAVLQGATVIGLIDGFFENVASVWHKEILFALSEGVQVYGGASMGALRAAECAAFGMIGVGEVFAAYAEGAIVDDDAVGQVHGPEELDYVALSDPLVNIEATLTVLHAHQLISSTEDADIRRSARALFFKSRTYADALAGTASLSPSRRDGIDAAIRQHRRDVKREDAMALMRRVSITPDIRVPAPTSWKFEETQMWRRLRDGWAKEGETRRIPAAAT